MNFLSADYEHRARGKLRKLRKIGSVSRYLSEFRNIVLTIPGMTDDEKFDESTPSQNQKVKIEVLKSTAAKFEKAA